MSKMENLMARQNSHLSMKQIKIFKNKLLKEKEDILNKTRNLDECHLDKNELSDPLDEASINIQTSTELRFKNRQLFYLKKINKTLTKIESNEYGLCNDCDEQIDIERLNARTTAELCISCKEESELTEKNNFIERKSKSLGRSLQDMN